LAKPFTKVGKEVAEEKKDKIKEISATFIDKLPIETGGVATKICRGDAPHGMDEYKKVAGDACVDFMCKQNADEYVKVLLPEVEECIKKHSVTSNWKSLLDNYNSLSAQISSIDAAKKYDIKLEPIEFDLNTYIVKNLVQELGRVMGEDEAEIRKAGNHKDAKYVCFQVVFSGQALTENHFNAINTTVAK